MTRSPNLFLVGAPKCATTSVAGWLAGHPSICISEPKEPEYFDSDRAKGFELDHQGYLRFFRHCDGHDIVGDASTTYLRSAVAIDAIERACPDARYVVGLRNPVDMAFSWHGQAVFEAWETEADFAVAWQLQDARRNGDRIPRSCRDVGDLLYGDVCMIGRQVERLVEIVGRERVCFYTVDQLREPAVVYRRILGFLDLDDDGRVDFPRENVAREVPRWLTLAHRRVSDWKRRVGLERTGLGVVSMLTDRFERARTSTISPELRSELTEFFRDDVALLARVTGLDVTAWSAQPG